MPREQGAVFDEVARTYDRARPAYPPEVFEEVLGFAALAPGERLLEIGAGTGKATRGFAGRGFPILCIEPGAQLAAVLKEHCGGHDVTVAATTFEAWPVETAAFGLVFAAQSFHWVDPEQGFDRCAQALRPGGTLALFGNRPRRGEAPVHRAVEACYAGCPLQPDVLRSYSRNPYPEQIAAQGGFGPVVQSSHPFQVDYDATGYCELLETQSDHRMLDPAVRADLFARVADAIRAHGGTVSVDFSTDLLLVRRNDRAALDSSGVPREAQK